MTATPPRRQANRPDTWVEHLRDKLPAGTRRRVFYDRLALPVDEPTEFRQTEKELVGLLWPRSGDAGGDAARSKELLEEAAGIYARAEDRAAGAVARATTLQGAVAIATSLMLSGTALVIDQAKLQGTGWRAGFACLLVGATVSFVMAGLRALSATSTIHRWHRPTATRIVDRAASPALEARVRLAAETLIAYSYNTKVAAWKVAYLGAAAWWFRIALAFLVAVSLLVAAYCLAGRPAAAAAEPADAHGTQGQGTSRFTLPPRAGATQASGSRRTTIRGLMRCHRGPTRTLRRLREGRSQRLVA